MATIKAYTDLSQSKVLAKILPLESADMHYNNVSIKGINYVDEYRAELMDYNTAQKVLSKYSINPLFEVIPCWSLAALLNVLPKGEAKDVELCFGGYKGDKYIPEWFCSYEEEESFIIEICHAPNTIDACYKMILKLHKSNLL